MRPVAGRRSFRILRMRDVHLDEGFCICRGKGDKERMVPLGARAIAAVRDLSRTRTARSWSADRARAADWVLLSYRGRRLRRERIWELLKRYCGSRRGAAGDQPAHVATQFCHAPAGRRGRSSPGARDARPRQHRHHADLHARRSDAAEGDPQEVSPEGVRRKAERRRQGVPTRSNEDVRELVPRTAQNQEHIGVLSCLRQLAKLTLHGRLRAASQPLIV